MSRLEIFQSLLTMDTGRSNTPSRSLEEIFALVSEAGFTGIGIDLSANAEESRRKILPLLKQYNLRCLINAFPTSMEDMLPIFETARKFDAVAVNIIARVIPTGVDEATLVVQDWMEEAEKEGVAIEFETHRSSMTNDLSFTVQLLDALPDMPICADLSHYTVDREFTLPLPAAEQALIDKILRRACAFQGRIASAQQIQLPIEFPQHQQWVVLFLDWWESGFRHWRKRAKADETLIFQTELAPPEYAMTGPDGMEMSDRWQESLIIKGWIEDIWARLDKEDVDNTVTREKTETSQS